MEAIKKDRSLIDGLLDIIRGIKNNLAIKFAKSERAMLDEAERNLVNLLRTEAKAVDNAKFSISEHIIGASGKDYGKGVILDTDKFEGKSPRKWHDEVKEHVYEALAGKEITLYNDGIPETVYFAEKEDRAKKGDNNNKILDKLAYNRKNDNARNLSVIHIEELAETSERIAHNDDNSHGWMDTQGWDIRTTFAQNIFGDVFEITLSVARNENKNILYDISGIKKVEAGQRSSLSSSKGQPKSSTENNIAQPTNKINGKKASTRKPLKYDRSKGTDKGKFSLKITDKDSHKARQLDIVLNTNPMHDDYHTGIRTVEDIYTADEVFNEDEFSGTPDWTIKNAQAALDKGKVTVYSSYPIKDGVFVTPSKMIAQDYAGDGRVYSKEVPLEDVAWISSEEGQLAQVGDSTRYSQQTDFYPYDGENAKSRGIRKTAVYDLADGLGSMFGITGKIGKDGMRKEAFRIADKVEKFGYITKADMDNFFDAAVKAARFTDEKADYAELKKRIRETGIEPLGGREYLDFLQKYKGKVKFKRGGMPIDTLYNELAEQFPEYVGGSANNQQDMMWQLPQLYFS